MQIDVLLATAEKGGVENIIKMMIEDLECPNMSFRVVQLVWEGNKWLPEKVPYYPLLEGKGNYSLDTFVDAYTGFLRENGLPDMILATVWPYTVYVARESLDRINGSDDKPKVISWMHHEMCEYKKTFDNIEEWLGLADGHFAINEANYKSLKDLFNVPVYKLKNPIDMSGCKEFVKHRQKIQRKKNRDVLKLAYIGRISREKNIELVIGAISLVQGCKLLIIGSAEDKGYERELHTLASEIGVENKIIWKGWQADPWSCVKDCDVICLSSLYEGFPLAALESLAHGIPVVASRTTGIREIIEDGITGYIFNVGDLASLIEVLSEISKKGTMNIDPQKCHDSVIPYERHSALNEMKSIIMEL